ncbi:MAG: coiled coil domain-containing protein [Thermodesulfobacteriota bacterium]
MSVKKDYQHKLEVELREWDERIKRLDAMAEEAKPEDKAEYVEHAEYLKAKQENVRKRLEKLKQAHESIWEGLKDGIDSIVDDMVNYYESVASRFKE